MKKISWKLYFMIIGIAGTIGCLIMINMWMKELSTRLLTNHKEEIHSIEMDVDADIEGQYLKDKKTEIISRDGIWHLMIDDNACYMENGNDQIYIIPDEKNKKWAISHYDTDKKTWTNSVQESKFDVSKIEHDKWIGNIETKLFALEDIKIAFKKEYYIISGNLLVQDIVKSTKFYSFFDEKTIKNASCKVVLQYKKNTEKLTEVKIKCQNIDIVSYGKIDEINIDVVIGNINEGKINVPEQVLPDYEEVAVEVKNQNNTDIPLENDTDVSPVLASLVYNVSFVTSDVIEQSINDSHMLMPSEDILIIMTNMLNNNTLNQISKKLQMYNKWNQNNKLAIAYFYGLGVFSLEDLSLYAVDTDEVISNYEEICNKN